MGEERKIRSMTNSCRSLSEKQGASRGRETTARKPHNKKNRWIGERQRGQAPPPTHTPRIKLTRRVHHPVLIGHAASLTPY
jgi:hypothetical protein